LKKKTKTYLKIIDMFYLPLLQWKWYASIREKKD